MRAAWMVALEETLAADETGDELATALVVIASVAGERVMIDEQRARAATRRALLLLTAGGDPTRGLDLNGRAVTALADDIRDADRQLMLEEGIRELAPAASGLPHLSEAVHALIHAPDVAWRAYACSLLAEELGAEDD
ncbi:MAG: hypothetical protein M3265_10340 [Actinomycetota bacterium]|jgi:hypothetical protein|nr:hypothetical protein [Actinomycetota bacterium]